MDSGFLLVNQNRAITSAKIVLKKQKKNINRKSIGKEKKMEREKVVLCGASTYEQKYYFNPQFSALPQQIQDELKITCVIFTSQISCVFTMEFDEEGNLDFVVQPNDDFAFDEIGSGLKIKELQRTKQELWEELELYYKVFFLGQKMEENQIGVENEFKNW